MSVFRIRPRTRSTRTAAALTVATVFVAGALWWAFSGSGDRTVTAYFDRVVGVYPGSDVKVLGVPVGEVVAVTPNGERVELTMTVAGDAPVARDTRALIVSPSVVADRYVQLSDLARGGPRLTDRTVIPRSRTAVPVELDELYASLDDLVVALGPEGANADGALSDLLDTGAAALNGNDAAFAESVRDFGDLARTLAGSDQGSAPSTHWPSSPPCSPGTTSTCGRPPTSSPTSPSPCRPTGRSLPPRWPRSVTRSPTSRTSSSTTARR